MECYFCGTSEDNPAPLAGTGKAPYEFPRGWHLITIRIGGPPQVPPSVVKRSGHDVNHSTVQSELGNICPQCSLAVALGRVGFKLKPWDYKE